MAEMTTAADESYEDFVKRYNAERAAAALAIDPAWGMRAFKGHNTRDGYAYVFRLTLYGKVVAWVEDEGRGGSVFVGFNDGRNSPTALRWNAEAERLFPNDGGAEERLVDAILTKAGK